MSGLTTGQLAQQSGVNVETIRFYERRGLLPEPPRQASGYRRFPEASVQLIRFIKRAQRLGFTLREVRELLELRIRSRRNCSTVMRRTKQKLADVRSKIDDLREMEQALAQLLSDCVGEGPISCCAILQYLGGSESVESERM